MPSARPAAPAHPEPGPLYPHQAAAGVRSQAARASGHLATRMMTLAAQSLVPAEHSRLQQAGPGVLLSDREASQEDPADHMGETVEQSVMHSMTAAAAAAAGSQQGHTCLLEDAAADRAADRAADCAAD